MSYGLLYEVKLIKADGSVEVLEHEATPHRCALLERRLRKLNKLGYNAKLKFRVSGV